MLKIYRAFNREGKIALQDHIEFEYGRFDTGLNGFGDVIYPGCPTPSKIVNYDYVSSKNYVKVTREFARIEDGYATRFHLNEPLSYEELETKFKNVPKTEEAYKMYHLNETGILLFTQYINLDYINEALIKRVFGRYSETGLYLLKPGACLTMSPYLDPEDKEYYEVLQSKTLGKRLILQRMDRKI